MTITVRRSTDVGAPQLLRAHGNACLFFDDVLVAIGWTIAFTGANKRAYRSPSGGIDYYLRVQDDQYQVLGVGNADPQEYATLALYVTMSDVDTGTGASPDQYFWKTTTQSFSGPSPWSVYTDGKFIIFLVSHHGDGGTYDRWELGEFIKYGTDAWNVSLTVNSIPSQPFVSGYGNNHGNRRGKVPYGYSLRGFDQATAGSPLKVLNLEWGFHAASVFIDYEKISGRVQGRQVVTPGFLTDATLSYNEIRGRVPGVHYGNFWVPHSIRNFTQHVNTLLAGRTLEYVNLGGPVANGSDSTPCYVDITGPWA